MSIRSAKRAAGVLFGLWWLLAQSAIGQPDSKATMPLEKLPNALGQARQLDKPGPAVKATLRRARRAAEDGHWNAVLAELDDIERLPGGRQAEVWILRAKAHSARAEPQQALAAARQAVTLAPDSADAHYLLGMLLAAAGTSDEAISHLHAAALAGEHELDNVNVTLAWFHLSRLLANAGYTLAAAQAAAAFDEAIFETHTDHCNAPAVGEILATHPRGLLPERLEWLRSLGRYADVLEAAEWARDNWPDDLRVTAWYIEALSDCGRADEAFELASRKLRDKPDKCDVLLPATVTAAARGGRLTAWLEDLARQVSSDGGPPFLPGLLEQLSRSPHAGQALGLARAWAQVRADSLDSHWVLARIECSAGDLPAALATLAAFVRQHPDAALLSTSRLTELRAWVAGTPGAAGVLAASEPQEVDFAAAYVWGLADLIAGNSERAEKLLDSCLSKRPDFSAARLAKAELLLLDHDWQAAEELAREVLKDDAGSGLAHYILARVYDGLDENRKAQREFKRAIRSEPHRVEYKLGLARHYLRQGDLVSAQRFFQSALADDEHCAEAVEGLLDCYLRGGKGDVARALLQRVDVNALPPASTRRIETMMRYAASPFDDAHLAELARQFEQHPDDVATARLLTGGLFVRSRHDEALRVAEKALRDHPDDYHLLSVVGKICIQLGEYERAIAAYERLRSMYPNRRHVLENLARAYLYNFQPEKAREMWRHLLSISDDPQQCRTYRQQIGDSYLTFREFDEALRFIEDWMQQEPDAAEVLRYTKLTVLYELHRWNEAFEMLDQLLKEASDSLQARDTYATFAIAMGRAAEAAERLRKWVAEDKSNSVLTERLVDALLAAGKPEEALEVARSFEGEYQESFLRRIWMARCEAAMGKVDTAIREVTALLREERAMPGIRSHARNQLIIALQEKGEYDKALKLCDEWLEKLGNDSDVVEEVEAYQRWLYYASGRTDKYEDLLRKQLARSPDNITANNDLGYFLADSGRELPYALELIRKAVVHAPLNAAYLDSLGWVYYKMGKFEQASEYLLRGTRLRDGQDAVIYDHLGDVLWRRGDKDGARKAWERSLELADETLANSPRSDVERTRTNVKAKLDAVAAGREPPVAPLAQQQPEKEPTP